MRRLLTLLLALVMMIPLSAQPAQAAGGMVQVDGKILFMDKAILVTDTGVFLPAGVIAKALGGSVTWNAAEGQGVLEAGGKLIELTDGSASVMVNGYPVTISAPVQVKGGEVYLPATFLLLQFGGRLHVEHPALKDDRAMQLLNRAMEMAEANRDTHSELQLRLEEPGLFWTVVKVAADSQVRGSDALSTTVIEGPLFLKETQSMAMKGDKIYTLQDGIWEENPFGSDDLMSEFSSLLPIPMSDAPDFGLQLLASMLAEARLGEERVEGNAAVQDVHLVLNFGSLLGPIAGMGRLPDAEGLTENPFDMPELIMERAEAVVTVDLATGRAVSLQLDVALAVSVPLPSLTSGEEIMTTMRVEVYAKDSITPNSTPIEWPEGIE